MKTIEVLWGNKWIAPYEWTQIDKRTVSARVIHRLGYMETVMFKNNRNRTSWCTLDAKVTK